MCGGANGLPPVDDAGQVAERDAGFDGIVNRKGGLVRQSIVFTEKGKPGWHTAIGGLPENRLVYQWSI
jgi:hypothetical protein